VAGARHRRVDLGAGEHAPGPAEGPERVSAEILCIGTELLLGNITNGNARWVAEQLAALGIPHHRQQVVGDNRERLIAAVREAAARCRLLITTGGLGPTPDDLSTEAIAAAFDAPLVERPEVWADIQAKLAARGRPVTPSLRRQALLPVGAELLPNATGSAPGMIWSPKPGFTVITFPGVPSEMRAMWEATAVSWFMPAACCASGAWRNRAWPSRWSTCSRAPTQRWRPTPARAR
jgi:nicotinamide-nucleotide amidase